MSVQNKVTGLFGICSVIFEQNEGGDDNLNVFCLHKWQNRGWGR